MRKLLAYWASCPVNGYIRQFVSILIFKLSSPFSIFCREDEKCHYHSTQGRPLSGQETGRDLEHTQVGGARCSEHAQKVTCPWLERRFLVVRCELRQWICTWKSRQDTTESLRSDNVSDLLSIHLCVRAWSLRVLTEQQQNIMPGGLFSAHLLKATIPVEQIDTRTHTNVVLLLHVKRSGRRMQCKNCSL